LTTQEIIPIVIAGIAVTIAGFSTLIALYGAGLSSFLGYREWDREKRIIKLFFEHVDLTNKFGLLIFNSGHRPIVITSIGLKLEQGTEEGDQYYEPIYSEFISEAPNFPVLLPEGEIYNLEIFEPIGAEMTQQNFELSVYDIEGNVYKISELRSYNSKFGGYFKRK